MTLETAIVLSFVFAGAFAIALVVGFIVTVLVDADATPGRVEHF